MRYTLLLLCPFILGCPTDDTDTDSDSDSDTDTTAAAVFEGDWSTDDYQGIDADLSIIDGGYDAEWDDSNAESEVVGTYTDDGSTVVMTDVSGPFSCDTASATATYSYVVTETTLTLTAVTEPCAPRETFLTSEWTR